MKNLILTVLVWSTTGQAYQVDRFMEEDTKLMRSVKEAKKDRVDAIKLNYGSYYRQGRMVNTTYYSGLSIGISSLVEQDWSMVESLVDLGIEFSKYLYQATLQRFNIDTIRIIVPREWPINSRVETNRRYNYTGIYNGINFESMPMRVYKSRVNTAKPRAIKGTQCGEEGRYIRIPSSFLTDSKTSLEKKKILFFEEWTKYRWGVFVSDYQQESCSKVVEEEITDCKSTKSKCYRLVETQSDQCRFCAGKSTWEVLNQHPDFASNLQVPYVKPSVEVSRQPLRRIVLALDASTSMLIGHRLESVREAVKRFIFAVAPNSFIGLVSFNKRAAIRHNLTLIDDADSRIIFSRRLPEDELTDEGTSIGGAVTNALGILELGPLIPADTKNPILRDYDHLTEKDGGEIVVLSDGFESHSPTAADKLELLKFQHVTVNTISLGNAEPNVLDLLATETVGQKEYSLFQPEETLTSLTNSFFALLGQNENDAQLIKNDHFRLAAGRNRYYKFSIDKTTGYNTHVSINFNYIGVKNWTRVNCLMDCVKLILPNGTETSKDDNFSGDFRVKFTQGASSLSIHLPGQLPPGRYNLAFANPKPKKDIPAEYQNLGEDISVSVAISSFANQKSRTYPIEIRPYVNQPSDKNGLYIYTEVSQGSTPMENASVWCEIYRPAGSGVDAFKIALLQLFDDGDGADLLENDGIYSAVYRDFLSPAKYSFRIIAHGQSSRRDKRRFIGSAERLQSKRRRRRSTRARISAVRQSRSQLSRPLSEAYLEASLGSIDPLSSDINTGVDDAWDRTRTVTAMPNEDSGKCPDTYSQVMDNCYYSDARQMEYYFAENHCMEKSGELVNAQTQDDILLAVKVTRDINRSVWLKQLNMEALGKIQKKHHHEIAFLDLDLDAPSAEVVKYLQATILCDSAFIKNTTDETYLKNTRVPDECIWMESTGGVMGMVRKTTIYKSSSSEYCKCVHSVVCKKSGTDVSAPEQIKGIQLKLFDDLVEISFKAPIDEDRTTPVNRYDFRLMGSFINDQEIPYFDLGGSIDASDPIFVGYSSNIMAPRLPMEMEVFKLNMTKLTKDPRYFVGNLEIMLDVYNCTCAANDVADCPCELDMDDLASLLREVQRRFKTGSFVTRVGFLSVQNNLLNRLSPEVMEILNELNALELLYRPHYPTIRLYVTNSRYSLWDITRWKRGIANTDFTCIINFNQEFEDDETVVVIKAPIIAENRNQTIPKEIPVMKFRHGQKFGNSSYVWSSIMSAAAQLVIQEPVWRFSISSYDNHGNLADPSTVRIISFSGRKKRGTKDPAVFGESKFGVGVFKTASEGSKQGNRYGEITKITVPSVAKMYDDGSDGMSGPAVAGLASGGGILFAVVGGALLVAAKAKKNNIDQMTNNSKKKKKRRKKKKKSAGM